MFKITPEEIQKMVDRFLQWKLPDNFAPDGGISFEKRIPAFEPVGTNLFDTTQAQEMVHHMLGISFQKDEYKYLADRLRSAKDDGEFKAILSNNHNIVIAALDNQSL